MSKASRKNTLAQAKAMGMKLSVDGKSWVPVGDTAVKVPISNHTNNRHVSMMKPRLHGLILVIFTFVGTLLMLSFLSGAFRVAFRDGPFLSLWLVPILMFQLFAGLFFLTPFYFWQRQPKKENLNLNVVGIGHQQIAKNQPPQGETEKGLMRIFGVISIGFLLLAIVVFLVVVFFVFAILMVIGGLGGGGW